MVATNFFLATQSRANNFDCTMSQQAEKDYIVFCQNLRKMSKNVFLSAFSKFCNILFSVAQNCNLSPLVHARWHKNSSVAQIFENSIFSFNGRNIPFLSRAISPKNTSIAQNCNVPMIRIITDLIRDSATYPEFQRSQHS